MYELLILAHLMRRPAHGYLIAKIINDIIGPYAKISNGRLYPLLSKLEQTGLITFYTEMEHNGQGDRQLRAYCITEAGKKRFHDLMMDITINPGEYQKIFLQKSCYLDYLEPKERLYIIDHYINYCQAHVLHLKTEAEDIDQQSSEWGYEWKKPYIQSILYAVQHTINQWQLELDWAISLRSKELESR